MVKVLITPWSGEVEGLGDAREMPLWAGRLGEATSAAVREEGMIVAEALAPGDEALVVPDGTALGPSALRAALAEGQRLGRDVRFRLGGRIGALLDQLAWGAGADGVIYLRPGGEPVGPARLAAAEVVALDPAERLLPGGLDGAEGLPVSDRLMLPVRHWLQLLWANLLGLGPALWGALVGRSAPLILWRTLRALVRARSLSAPRLAGGFTRLDRGAWAHPSAVVEGCWLGEGVRIGAGAVLRGCVLGAGVRVEEQALIEGVVAAPGAVVQRQAMLKFGVLGPGAAMGGVTQLSVLGAGAALKLGSYGMDQGLGRAVRVQVGQALHDAPMGLAGICLGAGALVGSGVHVAPGRVIPPNLNVLADHALTHPARPSGASGAVVSTFVVRGGRLVSP
jgi:acetyltransferase-like isoleucine patch superfamily enzyme